MKISHPLLVIVVALMLSCGPGDRTADEQGKGPQATEDVHRPSRNLHTPSCYLYATDRDTVYLKLNPALNGKVTGDLNYHFFERDGNTGFIEGEIHGDTLIADYTFLSEGLISVREVAFLLGEDQVMEGYGDVEEQDGRMVFWHTDSLDFSNGLILPEVPCEKIVQRNYDRFFPDSVINRN